MLSWMSRSLTSAWQLPRPPSSAESSSAPSGRLGQRVDLGKQLATLTQDLRAGRDKTIVLLTSSKIAVSAPLGGVCTVRAMSPPRDRGGGRDGDLAGRRQRHWSAGPVHLSVSPAALR